MKYFAGFDFLDSFSSEFFATFPHCTCLLSNSYSYLALDGVYHLIWVALANNLTLRVIIGRQSTTITCMTPPLWSSRPSQWDFNVQMYYEQLKTLALFSDNNRVVPDESVERELFRRGVWNSLQKYLLCRR